MKALVCELCGSNDIVKKGDYFVCQNCGTKYTAEAARKIMVEVTDPVEVTGNVEVKNVASLRNLFERAKGYLADNDTLNAEIYIERALDLDPHNPVLLKEKSIIENVKKVNKQYEDVNPSSSIDKKWIIIATCFIVFVSVALMLVSVAAGVAFLAIAGGIWLIVCAAIFMNEKKIKAYINALVPLITESEENQLI